MNIDLEFELPAMSKTLTFMEFIPEALLEYFTTYCAKGSKSIVIINLNFPFLDFTVTGFYISNSFQMLITVYKIVKRLRIF